MKYKRRPRAPDVGDIVVPKWRLNGDTAVSAPGGPKLIVGKRGIDVLLLSSDLTTVWMQRRDVVVKGTANETR